MPDGSMTKAVSFIPNGTNPQANPVDNIEGTRLWCQLNMLLLMVEYYSIVNLKYPRVTDIPDQFF